jgi:hypothetical protein
MIEQQSVSRLQASTHALMNRRIKMAGAPSRDSCWHRFYWRNIREKQLFRAPSRDSCRTQALLAELPRQTTVPSDSSKPNVQKRLLTSKPQSYSTFSRRVYYCFHEEKLKSSHSLLFINLWFEKRKNCPGVAHLSCQQFLWNMQQDRMSEECKTSASDLNSSQLWSPNCGSRNILKMYKTCNKLLTNQLINIVFFLNEWYTLIPTTQQTFVLQGFWNRRYYVYIYRFLEFTRQFH